MSRRHAKAHPCPTATKKGWPTREAAEEALVVIVAEHERNPIGEKVPCRAYLCECGHWHLTSARRSYAEIAAEIGIRERPAHDFDLATGRGLGPHE